jgi:tetratricopeptide (TPR) repeat protein
MRELAHLYFYDIFYRVRTNSKYIYIIKCILILLPFFILFNYANKSIKKPIFNISKQSTAFNYSHKILNHLNVGNKRLISDLLWVQTLLESDIEHYKTKDLNSWMYLRFNTIINIDPLFYEAYLYGGKYLSIIKDDDLGAKDIYDKAVKKFPNDYRINFNAGFHYYFELGDAENAARIFDRIKFHPNAPSFLPSLTARLKAKAGDLEAAFLLLNDTLERSKNKRIIKRLHKSMYNIRTELDLNCLNKNKTYCNKTDLDGVPYKLINGKYFSLNKWKPFRPED